MICRFTKCRKLGSNAIAVAIVVRDPRVTIVISSTKIINELNIYILKHIYVHIPGYCFTNSTSNTEACFDLSTFAVIVLVKLKSPNPSLPK